uniref:HVA22-like protein n=1 Tax=Alexandrium catenella TaxID=2925 RepID=A0A7S1QUS6_ALECA
MAISIVPYVGLMCFVAQYLYPAYESVTTMFKESPSNVAVTQWTIFWVICAVYAFLEHHFLFLLVDYLPLYLELKALAFLWLVHPQYLGAAWIWFGKVKGPHEKYDKEFYDKVMKALGPLGREAPAAAAAATNAKDE